MNREIKFRAWHKDLKKMFKIGQITLEKGTWNFEPNDRDFIGMSIPFQPSFVLMQYTGLHDKNGKEIYEGDIVKIKYRDEDIGKVIYEHNGFSIDVTNMNKNYGRVSFVNNFMEVIGNIYDNPELLGGE
jgi:uncharacterized phage protein (TIGR01671 family)